MCEESSHDGCTEHPSGILEVNDICSFYVSQQKVFDDLGRDILKHAFDGNKNSKTKNLHSLFFLGFNCSLFAYGQTGSGKSYSMIGYGVNRGIISITCDELFRQIENKKDTNIRFEVTLSMMEIYNEQVFDLLTKRFPKGGLTVRQHPISSYFYPQDLRVVPVATYNDIERLLIEGIRNRTIASTNMNKTSSRAHTIVTIHFDQIIQTNHGETKKMSTIHFVDLAGSEGLSSSRISDDRLNENTNINRSLLTLGNVVSALVGKSLGIKQKVAVPCQDSILTKLLQNSFGGNSKTIMIATISPADVHYNETLNTLIFADRVKRIKNFVMINEYPIEKLIHQLKEENQCLTLLIETGNYYLQLNVKHGMTDQDIELIRQQTENEILTQIQNNQKILQDSKISWDIKLKNARLDDENCCSKSLKSTQFDHTFPYLANLNEDPMLSYVLCHYLNTDEITIGRRDCTIYLNGLSILEHHAIIRHIDMNKYELSPAESTANIKVNGYNLNGTIYLQHKDCILFGANHLYVFLNPTDEQQSLLDTPTIITWEYAQKEIAKAKGFSLENNSTIEQDDIQQKILNLLPLISEVNAISEELNKYRIFEIILMPISSWDGILIQGSKLLIRMKNLVNRNVWFWDDVKFLNRIYIIKEHYQKFIDGQENILYIAKEDDPFWEPVEDVLIGTANVFLQSLVHSMDFDDEIYIIDYKGFDQGRLHINLSPCLPNGDILNKEHFIDHPDELLNKPFSFKITINYIEINDEHYNKGLRIRYKIFNELKFNETNVICRQTLYARINQTRIITIPNVDNNWLNFIDNGCIIFQIFALQEEKKSSIDLFKMTTRELKITEQNQYDTMSKHVNHPNISLLDDSKLKAGLTLLHRKYMRLEQKEKRIQQLCREWENHHDYSTFYKYLSAIAFSTGTKLKPTNMTEKSKENLLEIYLFGKEEQEYLKDIEQINLERQKYWNIYYEKMASKQNHVSLSYLISLQRSKFSPNQINNVMPQSLSITPQLNLNDSLIHDNTLRLNQEEDHVNNDNNNLTEVSWKRIRKSNKYHKNNDSNKILLNNEPTSTTCTIQ
ncbi:unnamed protein product [Rotaria sp. Silwood2]|nr:unnamed protein product [Rotaria sp. Silwood2]